MPAITAASGCSSADGKTPDHPGPAAVPMAVAPVAAAERAITRFISASDINAKNLKRWLTKSVTIQWDYKNVVKRKGKLLRLKQ